MHNVLRLGTVAAIPASLTLGAQATESIKKYFSIDVIYKFTPGGPMGEMGNKVVTEFRANHKASTDL